MSKKKSKSWAKTKLAEGYYKRRYEHWKGKGWVTVYRYPKTGEILAVVYPRKKRRVKRRRIYA